jgi:hypothetical protein
MQIAFVRSGGVAGMAMRVEGSVKFEDRHARVTSVSGYTRDLAPEEVDKLSAATQASALPADAASSGPGPLRDAYQYDITVTTQDGKTRKMTVHGDRATPEARELVDWVRRESDQIWRHRLQKR